MRGFSYRYTNDNAEFDSNVKNSNLNYRQQFLSIIPIGLNIHSCGNLITTYIYAGIGLGLLVNTNYHVVEYENMGSETSGLVFPTLNVGAGLEIKSISAEITPTGNGSGFFVNLGYSF